MCSNTSKHDNVDVKQIIFMSLMMCNERMLLVSDLIKDSIAVQYVLYVNLKVHYFAGAEVDISVRKWVVC